MNLTLNLRSETYGSLLSGSSATPSTGIRYEITWGNGAATGVYVGNGEVAATGMFLQNIRIQAASASSATITFPAANGTVTLNPSSGSYLVRPASGTFYLGQNNVSVGTTSTNAHTVTSSASAARSITIADVSGEMMIRTASGNLNLAETVTLGGTFKSTIGTLATAARSVTLPDASGTVVLQAEGQAFVSAFSSVLASDFSTTVLYDEATDLGASVPFPSMVLQPGMYLVTCFLILKSSVAGEAARFNVRFTGAQEARHAVTAEGLPYDSTQFLATANLIPAPNGTAYVANTEMASQMMFLLRVSSTGTLNVQLGRETNTAATITAVANSTVVATKLA